MEDGNLFEFSDNRFLSEWVAEPAWLDLDFIPVVHLPNTVNLQGHYGKSVLANIMQILDDIQGTDTDIQASSATTGSPPIVVSGKSTGGDVETVGPGKIFYVGDGTANIMDTSKSLDALLKLKDALLERLSVNSRTPESLLGRVKPNEVPSGIAITLSFTPHVGLVREMRMVRAEKYAILLKFVMRYFQMLGDMPRPASEGAKEIKSMVVMGSFLPADKQEVMSEVMNLYSAKAISLETAVTMLIESGYPIENLVEEVERIQSRDWEAGMNLMTLTGDPNRGLEYLGQDPTEVVDPMELDEGEGDEPAA